MIPIHFPESRPVFGHELNPGGPLDAFPGIEARNYETHWVAVCGAYGVVLVLKREKNIRLEEIVQRKVGCKTSSSMDHDKFGFREGLGKVLD